MIKLVVFDCDGVLADTESSWEYVHRKFGVDNIESLTLYLEEKIDDYEFIRRDVDLWRRGGKTPHISKIKEILYEIPIVHGAKETIIELKKFGIKTAIISGGIDILTERIKDDLKIDYNLSNGLVCDSEGYLTGEGIVRVSVRKKDDALISLLRQIKIEPEECAVVGDGFLDCPMFSICKISIAFNPSDDIVVKKAKYVIREKNLKMILKYILPYCSSSSGGGSGEP